MCCFRILSLPCNLWPMCMNLHHPYLVTFDLFVCILFTSWYPQSIDLSLTVWLFYLFPGHVRVHGILWAFLIELDIGLICIKILDILYLKYHENLQTNHSILQSRIIQMFLQEFWFLQIFSVMFTKSDAILIWTMHRDF